MTSTDGVFDFIKHCFASSKHSGVSLTMKYSSIQMRLDIVMEWLVDDPDILIRLVQLNRNRCLLNPTSWIMVKISGENFAGADVDDYKNPVMDRNVTQ